MRWWIVGRGGLLANAFEELCQRRGIDYIATSSSEVDITDRESVMRFSPLISHIINCAAYTAVDRAEDEPEKAFAVNEKGAVHLAQKAKEEGVRLIHFSTDYVFDGSEQRSYRESDQPDPLSIYGKSKLAGELALRAVHKEALIIRTSWLFGQGPRHFVKTMSELMLTKEEVRVVDDQWGRPTYAPHLAEATLELCNESGLLHISGKGSATWYNFAQAIYEELKGKKCRLLPITTEEYVTKARRPRFSILDTGEAEKRLKSRLPSWREGLKEYFHG